MPLAVVCLDDFGFYILNGKLLLFIEICQIRAALLQIIEYYILLLTQDKFHFDHFQANQLSPDYSIVF